MLAAKRGFFMKKTQLIISCEHASNQIPKRFQTLFKNKSSLLNSHAGLDTGALAIYKTLVEQCNCLHIKAEWSRLLIDLNRSLHHPKVFSEVTKPLSNTDKNFIIHHYYLPYRDQLTQYISHAVKQKKRVLHLSIHSFTPKLNNDIRHNDIGLLYDSTRIEEKKVAQQIKQRIIEYDASYQVRMNYPYLGKADGLTTAMRRLFPKKYYLGIEIESNQKHFSYSGIPTTNITQVLCDSLLAQ